MNHKQLQTLMFILTVAFVFHEGTAALAELPGMGAVDIPLAPVVQFQEGVADPGDMLAEQFIEAEAADNLPAAKEVAFRGKVSLCDGKAKNFKAKGFISLRPIIDGTPSAIDRAVSEVEINSPTGEYEKSTYDLSSGPYLLEYGSFGEAEIGAAKLSYVGPPIAQSKRISLTEATAAIDFEDNAEVFSARGVLQGKITNFPPDYPVEARVVRLNYYQNTERREVACHFTDETSTSFICEGIELEYWLYGKEISVTLHAHVTRPNAGEKLEIKFPVYAVNKEFRITPCESSMDVGELKVLEAVPTPGYMRIIPRRGL